MKLKVTPKGQRYLARRMKAGGYVEVSNRDAKILKARRLAVESDAPAAARGPGRPRNVAASNSPAWNTTGEEPRRDESRRPPLEEMTNPELRSLAVARGFDLPQGYVTNKDLIDMLRRGE
jgi:hypothetical protein